MNLKDYQAWVDRSCTPRVKELGLTYACLGLAGESGEVIERIKKITRDNREPSEEDKDYILLELGDVLWYVTKIANCLDLNMLEVLAANVEKIEDRKINGKRDAH